MTTWLSRLWGPLRSSNPSFSSRSATVFKFAGLFEREIDRPLGPLKQAHLARPCYQAIKISTRLLPDDSVLTPNNAQTFVADYQTVEKVVPQGLVPYAIRHALLFALELDDSPQFHLPCVPPVENRRQVLYRVSYGSRRGALVNRSRKRSQVLLQVLES